MFSIFKKKKIIPHIKLSGVIGNVGKFKQGIDFSGQQEIIKKIFEILCLGFFSKRGFPESAAILKSILI